MENSREFDKCLDTYVKPKMKQEDIKNLNNLVSVSKTEGILKTLPRKAQVLLVSLQNSLRTLKNI